MNHTSDIDQTLDVVSQVLIRCVVMGVVVLFIWWGALVLAGDLVYSVHSTLVPITRPHFDVIHYAAMLTTKAAVSLLFFFPYIAIRLVLKRSSGSQ